MKEPEPKLKPKWRVVNQRTAEVILPFLEIADHFWTRFKGLQGRADLEPGHGLLLVPCSSVHTFMMRFPIDLILLDRTGKVLGVKSTVRPWRMVAPVSQTYAIIEVKGGSALAVSPGDLLRLERVQGQELPASLGFLLKP
ncbi:MAG TPA: DUF192 domain-containing protein [Verrucomicrobiae bacterium]|jgi:uncharacterized membrane protein (UPF0127 family)|nr:DUF192 domain-containing protein [Verrucomicrobiae bacterium]